MLVVTDVTVVLGVTVVSTSSARRTVTRVARIPVGALLLGCGLNMSRVHGDLLELVNHTPWGYIPCLSLGSEGAPDPSVGKRDRGRPLTSTWRHLSVLQAAGDIPRR